MNKKLLITGAVFIGIGVFGIVPSLVSAVPYFSNMISKAENMVREERALTKIATVTEDVKALEITSDIADIRIVPSNSNKVEIYKTEPNFASMDVNYRYNKSTKSLEINESGSHFDFVSEIRTNNIETFLQDVLDRAFTDMYEANIEIRVPKAVDVTVQSQGEDTFIHRDAINKNISFKTIEGDIEFIDTFPKKQLGTLSIYSDNEVSLNVSDLQMFENVAIHSAEIEINNYNATGHENMLPKKVQLNANDVEVESNVAIAKELVINGGSYPYGEIDIRIPLNILNIDWDIKTDKYPINFDGEVDYRNSKLEKLLNDQLHEFKGSIVENDEKANKIIIRANNQEVYISSNLY